ncbi:DUF1801 domain-containing protein [Agaribacterium haliotis]|uniref:DUF1801 domain-containing protein n=1 Tax=Agaribacterium haliotis TaxID=2013869 RepID=UPI000BB5636A|nr:DUF1801 domain-containing protein [Agaribacterium haliotis]
MAELKTRPTELDVDAYLHSLSSSQKQADALELAALFSRVTQYKARLWGTSIIGYGAYRYRNHSGEHEWLMTGFAARSKNLTLYIMQGFTNFESELSSLGKHKCAKSCLYINKLKDIDMLKLEHLLRRVVDDMHQRYSCYAL